MLARLPLGLLGSEIPERRVDALPIVVALDVAEQISPGLLARNQRCWCTNSTFKEWKNDSIGHCLR